MSSKYANGKNFGWGKSMSYAARGALTDFYGGGRFGTVAAHNTRIQDCIDFAKRDGVSRWDLFDQSLADRYAADVASRVQSGQLSVAYGQNLVSTMNVTLSAVRGDGQIRVSPAASVGQRSHVRTDAPTGLDRGILSGAQSAMRDAGLDRAAALVGLAREFGMRLREASLANLDRLSREAQSLGRINIQEGTKGGREAPRWVEITSATQLQALTAAIDARPGGSQNLVGPDEQLKNFFSGEIDAARAYLKDVGIEKIHDLRAAYACERYQELTGHEAPVVRDPADPGPDRDTDTAARMQISEELGHGREDVVSAYIGGKS